MKNRFVCLFHEIQNNSDMHTEIRKFNNEYMLFYIIILFKTIMNECVCVSIIIMSCTIGRIFRVREIVSKKSTCNRHITVFMNQVKLSISLKLLSLTLDLPFSSFFLRRR